MLLPFLLLSSFSTNHICGKIVDHSDGLPLCNAMVYSGKDTVYTNHDGTFQLDTEGEKFFVEALGFKTKLVSQSENGSTIYLDPLSPIEVIHRKKK